MWKRNSSIFNDQQLKGKIEQFIQENNKKEVTSEIVWDTLKAVFRGKIISYCAKKKRQESPAKLTEELEELETRHKKDSNLNIQLKETRKAINTLYTQETHKKMFFTKQKYYETGSKFAKLLARKLQKQKADSIIHKIRDPITKDWYIKGEEYKQPS